MKAKGIFGCTFILISGILFTVERYLAVLQWSVLTEPVLTRGSGEYFSLPTMPNLTTNSFVIIFLIIGFLFLILEVYEIYKDKCTLKRIEK